MRHHKRREWTFASCIIQTDDYSCNELLILVSLEFPLSLTELLFFE